ncbi:energy transducer TonB [Rhodoblastus sphagnicola]|uniref:Energy transducer TonB n=1 Tax=Rhodoblastus sphagnicola TaxID=333368 RepID=A0A2S6NAW7_9HYPH|nr:energy transducer TonB [Rhodoblastus sphagnicola]
MESQSDDESEEGQEGRRQSGSYLRRGATVGVIALAICGGIYVLIRHDDMAPPLQVRDLTIFTVAPPPPPPPPPPEQKMIEQPKVTEQEINEQKPVEEDKPIDKPKDEPLKDVKNEPPPGPLALDAKAEGPGDAFNLGGKPGGSPYGGGGGGSGGSRWGGYSAMVSSQIEAALRGNAKTRNASVQMQVRLWADATGRITRVQLGSSTGDAELDAVIRNEVLGALTLRSPPPADMPMPIVTRITERRPG